MALAWAPPIELAARSAVGTNGSPVLEAPLLRPIDLRDTHGFEVDQRMLDTMLADYDPLGIEAAAINFDHSWDGPAHGWLTKLWLEAEHLWFRAQQLSQEVVDGIVSGQWVRRSAELVLKHPVTGRPYLTGVALLGKKSPAVPGLPPLHLHRPVFVIGSQENAAMSDKKSTTPTAQAPITFSADQPTGASPAAATSASPDTAQLAATAAQVQQLTAELSAANERSRQALAESRQIRAEGQVDKDLARLSTRIPPAMLRAGLREALLSLAAAETPATVHLSVVDGAVTKQIEKPLYGVLVGVLEAMPESALLTAGELAGSESDAAARLARDTRDSATLAIDTSAGISAERRLELQRKYPGSFGDETAN